jgi:hypothetical protein
VWPSILQSKITKCDPSDLSQWHYRYVENVIGVYRVDRWATKTNLNSSRVFQHIWKCWKHAEAEINHQLNRYCATGMYIYWQKAFFKLTFIPVVPSFSCI